MDELLATCLGGEDYTVYSDFAPQGIERPYGIYTVILNARDNHSNGQGNLKEVRYQIDVYADTKAVAKPIAESIESKLLGCTTFKAFIYQSFGGVEDDTKVYKSTLDFKLWK